ncbi:MAG TPA: fused MFS/spermidine synthase, partial [Candidatus Sulfopaludibacter sp.]|nr:fused MFS/spermidine synthase [Candidatus Sulfopaludibacter sp.]
SLVYEVVWLRLCMAKFGVTTPMVSIVLSVFMAGLGIGSWAGGALVKRLQARSAVLPLRLYGTLELLIGLSALVAPWTIGLGYGLLRDAGKGLAWGSSIYYLASGAWVAVALLPWCTCMGATFPFAMAAIRGLAGKDSAHSFSYLYLANVLGAMMGTLLPALVLIELYGFRGTLYVACALNVALAATVFTLSASALPTPAPEGGPSPTGARPAVGTDVLWYLFATGICSLAIEVVWIREFTFYLGNVVYAFAIILALYLLATWAGSTLYRRRVHAEKRADGTAAWIWLGIAALLPLTFADPRLPDGDLFGIKMLRAALGIAPFSALAGFLTPMLVDRWSEGDPDRAGRAYAVNVVGSILGPLVAGFAIIPLAGERWGLCLIALPLFAIGLRTALHATRDARRAFAVLAAISVAVVVGSRGYEWKYPHRVELRDSTATVIATGAGMDRELLVNGIGMTRLTTITKMMAHMPLAMLPRPPQNGLVICFGMGTSFRSMLSWDIPTTAVDLVPSVPKLFWYFHADASAVIESPLAHVVVDDGRRYLERSREQYDVILTDPPPPMPAPASSLLYSEEFYAIVKPHLRPGGIAQIWVPGADDQTLSAITKALVNSFPYVRAYDSIEGWGIHFLAGMQPIPTVTGAALAAKLPPRAAQDLLEWETDTTPEKLFDEVLDSEEDMKDFVAPAPNVSPITDNRPINEYFFLRRYLGVSASRR